MEIPASSIEYVKVPVGVPAGAEVAGARLAFVTGWRGRPVDTDWQDATYAAGQVVLRYNGDRPRGTLGVWVEITAGDEVVVRRAGSVRLT